MTLIHHPPPLADHSTLSEKLEECGIGASGVHKAPTTSRVVVMVRPDKRVMDKCRALMAERESLKATVAKEEHKVRFGARVGG